MLRGCVFALIAYAAVAYGYFWWLNQVFEPPVNWIGALVAGFATFCCWGALLNAWRFSQDRRLVRAAQEDLPPLDGQIVAAVGTIHSFEKPVVAPFSGTKCVLCEYEIQTVVSRDGKDLSQGEYSGFLMNPCFVRTKFGKTAILGFPQLDDFAELVWKDESSARRALGYLRHTDFQDVSGLKLIQAFSELKDVWCDDDGSIHKNLRLRSLKKPSLFSPELEAYLDGTPPARDEVEDEDEERADDQDEDEDEDVEEEPYENRNRLLDELPTLKEKYVKEGAAVCVIGRYDAEKQGLVPASSGAGRLNRLIPGSAESIENRLRGSARSHFWGALVVLLITHGVIYGAMQLYLHNPQENAERVRVAFDAVQQNDVGKLQTLLQRKFNIRARDSQGRTLLMAAREPAMAKFLIEQGVDLNVLDNDGSTALMEHARTGHDEIVAQMIAAGVDLNTRHRQYNTTALMQADGSGRFVTAELLRKAGAEDDVVTAANGQQLPDDGGEPLAAVKAYIDAIHANDLAAMPGRISQQNPAKFTAEDMREYASVRPLPIASHRGFMTADRATVYVIGRCPAGFEVTWGYQVVREAEGWKVLRERWVTDGMLPPEAE